MVTGKVTQITIGPDGQVTGTYDNNPYLNSIIYMMWNLLKPKSDKDRQTDCRAEI